MLASNKWLYIYCW